jgi:hypothetical protein
MTLLYVLIVELLFTAQAQRKDLTGDTDGTEMNIMVITEEAEPSEA